jgi:hypothetical protein
MTQTPDITPEAVGRYDFFGYDTYSESNETGEWVRASDYDTLNARAPDDRGTAGPEWIAQEEARAQKLVDALAKLEGEKDE